MWGGVKSPHKFSSEEYKTLVYGLRSAATLCDDRNTYTVNIHSTMKLLKDVGHDNLYSYLQPPALSNTRDNLKELD